MRVVVVVGRRRFYKFYFDSKMTVLRKIFFFIHVYNIDAYMKSVMQFLWVSLCFRKCGHNVQHLKYCIYIQSLA